MSIDLQKQRDRRDISHQEAFDRWHAMLLRIHEYMYTGKVKRSVTRLKVR